MAENRNGSIAPMNEVVHHFLENSKAPLHEVIAMATANPARDLGVFEQLGSLEPGKLADIVLVSPDDFQVKKTLIDGQVVYTA